MAAVNDANRKTGLILELLLCFNVSLSIFMYPTLNMYLCRGYATFIIGLIINLTQSSIIVVKISSSIRVVILSLLSEQPALPVRLTSHTWDQNLFSLRPFYLTHHNHQQLNQMRCNPNFYRGPGCHYYSY